MARPRGKTKTARLTVGLDEQAYATLCHLAKEGDVPVAWHVRSAVSELIERYNEEEQEHLPLRRATREEIEQE